MAGMFSGAVLSGVALRLAIHSYIMISTSQAPLVLTNACLRA